MKRRREVRSSKIEVRKTSAKARSGYEVFWSAEVRGFARVGALIRKAVVAALHRQSVGVARVEITGVSDRRIARLNRECLGHAGPTDVLTFDLGGGGDEVEGVIVLSLETARREARRRGHSVSAEAALYAVHGVLHLLGYDDLRIKDAERMHRIEDEILKSIGEGTVYAQEIGARRR